jgi:GR25 family glycosyltransferase involved in LPS biosynthesis
MEMEALVTLALVALLGVAVWFLRSPVAEPEHSYQTRPLPNPFSNHWGEAKEQAVKLLRGAIALLDEHRIDSFLAYGTLLGYVRQQELIPWDNDLDLVVVGDPEEVRRLFGGERAKRAGLRLVTHPRGFDKVFFQNAKPIDGYDWSWPFVDLFYAKPSDRQLTVFYRYGETTASVYPLEWIFPLLSGRFYQIAVKLPRQASKVLTRDYGREHREWCLSSGFDHQREEKVTPVYRVKCRSLKTVTSFPTFVINLRHRIDRRENVLRQLRRVGITRPRFERAVEASSIQSWYRQLPSDKISIEEVACGLSHIRIWQRIVRDRLPVALVLEDDIVVPEDVDRRDLTRCLADGRGGHLVLLGYCGGKAPVFRREERLEAVVPGSAVCLHAYFLTLEGARELLRLASRWRCDVPIDWVTEKMCQEHLCFLATSRSNPKSNYYGHGIVYQDRNLGTDISNKRSWNSYHQGIPAARSRASAAEKK